MGKLIIVANRLPYSLNPNKTLQRSTGGLASALGPLHEQGNSIWIGSSDKPAEKQETAETKAYQQMLLDRNCLPVFLPRAEKRKFYEGFSNSTIWPLFHDFPTYAHFEEQTWDAYCAVNKRFCDVVLSCAEPGDTIWVQDYLLMLLPALLRAQLPHVAIGFFLHIPFPDYERFRMLPWRSETLEGLLGADLIGFHAYDYVRHFLSSCRRILGQENFCGCMTVGKRLVYADVFPLGIEYERFATLGKRLRHAKDEKNEGGSTPHHETSQKNEGDCENTQNNHHETVRDKGLRRMLSVERLDYSKGIPNLLRAYDLFLQRHPEWLERVELSLLTVPSREHVGSYKRLRREVDGLVGRINGAYATPTWTPLRYYYRSVPFEQLCHLYAESDVMLVTPLRDGMNLVCKEYLAVHDETDGVLILSELAGAAGELNDALLINPFNLSELADSIHRALIMPREEQLKRNALMQGRLRRYTSNRWGNEFLKRLKAVKEEQAAHSERLVSVPISERIVSAYRHAHKRAIVLDYDGTLVPFAHNPAAAAPDKELYGLLENLVADKANEVVVLSGRNAHDLEKWFGDLAITMVAEHGLSFWDHTTRSWTLTMPVDDSWMTRLRPLLQGYVDSTPGSLLEEKRHSLVWHYRACSIELAERRVEEIKRDLSGLLIDLGLQVADGSKVLEFKQAKADKGSAAHHWFSDETYDFVLAAGDDTTDEDMFRVAPPRVWTIHVGIGPTLARFFVHDSTEFRSLLGKLTQ